MPAADGIKKIKQPILSIRARLMLLALLAVVPLMLDRVRVLEASRSDRIEAASREAMDLARRAADAQNEMVVTLRALLQTTAHAYVTASTTLKPADACAALDSGFVEQIHWINSLSVAASNGTIICSTEPRAVGIHIGDRGYFLSALSNGGFVISDYLVGRATHQPLVIAAYPVVLRDDTIVMMATVNLAWMSGIAAQIGRHPGTVVNLIDGNGVLLSRYPALEHMVGTKLGNNPLLDAMLSRPEGLITAEGIDGERRIYAFAPLPWTGAHIAVGLAETEVLSRIDRMIYFAYGQLGIFGLVALFGAWFAGERLIVTPVRALARHAARFGRGEFEMPLQPQVWMPEFQALAEALDDMARKLAERERELRNANHHLTELATSDGLSGLANRRGFDARLEAEWQLAAELKRPIALLMIDVDHFKSFNDRYGHLEGDHCLRGVGEVLTKICKGEAEFPARYGGEEFALLLPGVDLEAACELAERLRRAVECLSFANSASPWGYVTISVGVASLTPEEQETAEKLVEAADAGLYAAKNRGRNTVVAHAPLMLAEAG
ncbi:MAG TPA: diguanylate cyclase [Xanthobacteraceae bacterium]|nr:diguanylate cyclase [Xanthobacteraceae bacterium]